MRSNHAYGIVEISKMQQFQIFASYERKANKLLKKWINYEIIKRVNRRVQWPQKVRSYVIAFMQ